jgi:hypothetical protein
MQKADTIALSKIICEFISKQCSLQSLRIDCSVLESETIIRLLRNLKDLTLTCLNPNLDYSIGYRSRCILPDIPELSKLTELHLFYTTINDEDLQNIATKASHLKTLILIDCANLSDIGIGYIADGCHCLGRLVVYYLRRKPGVPLFPSTLESLGKACQKLKYLDMGNGSRLDDTGVIALVQNCHDLEYLELCSKHIASPSLHAISHFCSNLLGLTIDGDNFNAASIESLLTKNRFIKYASIGTCRDINAIDLCKSTEAKSGILETHSHVSKLEIRASMLTGYSAIEQIVTFCPDVRELTLPTISTPVRDDVIEFVFHKCRFLETLTIDLETINRIDLKTNLK